MRATRNDGREDVIRFGKVVTSYGFYTKVLDDLLRIYRRSVCVSSPPVFDFRETKYINPSVVPVLLAFGDYVCRLYHAPARIIYEDGSAVQKFFATSRFYEISRNLSIFEWDDMQMDIAAYTGRRIRKVSFNNKRYADADKIQDQIQKRNYIFDCLKDKSKIEYRGVLEKADGIGAETCDAIIDALAEIGTNSVLYSNTYSFSYVTLDSFRVQISMADSGIGFEKSFEDNKRNLELLNLFPDMDNKFRNYLVIMSVLQYSYEKHINESREDLWTLRTKVINNRGIFKIQYANTQVIFSYSRCGQCKGCYDHVDVSACTQCLLKDYSSEVYSPIKIYGIKFQGVRVEISFEREA